ncbi:NAD(P)H-hydrate dehydratase [uncultured Jannaschia sp.]|uniref:NAD(P)H-hydrate dehydratase n=1 Tax=uncultured Jannaschia sp. TaxID=293347 RepID=UPI00263297FE|nr:NAD(P)H-hydrate dehydratase [uncultured Jannaschia sp.]
MADILLTAVQMRALERAAIDSGAVRGIDLMERAGRGAVEAVLAHWPALAAAPCRAVVLCGPGNNGGDGFVVARLLHQRGWEVDVQLHGGAEALPPDARANHDRWRALGEVGALAVGHAPEADLVVDALFGAGLSRDLPDDVLDLATQWTDARAARVVALDAPTGLCLDSGRRRGGCLPADLTVALHGLKPGHVLADGSTACGTVRVVGIGLTSPDDPALARLVAGDRRVLKVAGHKYDHGHALVLSGGLGLGRTGAARLAARGALRVGAGLVTLGAPGAALLECAGQVTAIMLRRCDDGAALAARLDDARITALCLGPGLGIDARGSDLVAAALASGRPAVLDADALTLLAGAGIGAPHGRCILTPHDGEFARLCPEIAARLAAPPGEGPAMSRLDAARAAAATLGAVVLLKGPATVIAAPDGRVAVNAAVGARAAPWLATAGSGDVLAGIATGLLARGFAPFDAACQAAWLHVEAARAFGPGLIAEDLPEMLPHVFSELARAG